MPKEGFPPAATSCSVSDLIQKACTTAACAAPNDQKAEVEKLLKETLPKLQLDDFEDTPANQRGYCRKLLYTHPSGFFSVLQLKWLPGAETPVHGHNAWGCVGVVSGKIGCETYDAAADEPNGVLSNGVIEAGTGAIATVDPNPKGIHRLFNPTDSVATTIHIYGMDLSENPCAINVPYGKRSH